MRLAGGGQASRAPASPIQPGAAVAAQRRRIITICRTSSTSCSSIATGNIPAPISARRMTIIDTAQQNKKRHIAAKLLLRPGHAGARYRLGLGRAGALSGRRVRCRRHRADPVRGAAQGRESARRRRRAGRPGPVSSARLPRGERALRPHRLGRHVRACRRQPVPGVFPQVARRCWRRTGSRCCIRSAAWTGPARPIRGCASTSSRAAIRRPCPRSCRMPSGRGCGSPISRSCACTTPRRCAPGAAGSSATATASARCTTSASAACGRCIWSAPSWRSAAAAIWCSRCSSPRQVDAVPLTRDYMLDWERARQPARGRRPRRLIRRPARRIAGEG